MITDSVHSTARGTHVCFIINILLTWESKHFSVISLAQEHANEQLKQEKKKI